MASKTVTLNDAAYTKLDTGAASALDVQNLSTVTVRVRFAASQPAATPIVGFTLDPADLLERGSKTNDMWGICVGATAADVEVGE